MSQHPTKQPIELKIDVEQWRRDIQTFVDTTSRALNAIAGELSNSCSNGFEEPAARFGDPADSDHSIRACDEPMPTSRTKPADDRLAKLKAKLAKRISKSN